jgi:ATP-binding protein involved in chromosome partitioning
MSGALSEEKERGEAFVRQVEETNMIRARMGRIRHKIAVISGKGGVGKSLVTVNLAAVLAKRGKRVGILDADIHGPTVPKMLGLKGSVLVAGEGGIEAPEGALGIRAVSMDFLLPSQDAAVIWRGPMKMGVIRQFLSDVDWGDLDYLLIDLPPGTGDEPLTVLQNLPDIDGVVIVTIPSQVSGDVVEKSITFARQMKARVIGVVENMSGLVCPGCGEVIEIFGKGAGRAVSEEMDVPFLGSIPLDPKISEDADAGTPFASARPDAPAAKAFEKIVDEIVKSVED